MKITVLGLGAMGTRLAARLVVAGHAVTVWNRAARDIPGATAAPSPRTAATGAEVVLAMLRDDAAAEAVWLDPATGAMAGMDAGALGIDCSTLSPGMMQRLHAARPAGFVEAPVIGSRPQAEAGALIFLAAGPEADVARARPLLLQLGGAVHETGGPGTAAALKLMVNSLFAQQVAALAETISMLGPRGLDPAVAMRIFGETPVASPAMKGAAAGMLARVFQPMFPIELVVKDLGLAMDAGAGSMTQAALAVYQRAIAAGLGAENITAVARL